MRVFLVGAVSLCLATSAWAEAAAPANQAAYCSKFGEVAAGVMRLRQSGAVLSEVMTIAKGDHNTTSMIKEAFKTPRFNTEKGKTDAEIDFRNEAELMCFSIKE